MDQFETMQEETVVSDRQTPPVRRVKQKKRKKSGFLPVLVLMLVFALLGGLAGSALTGYFMQKRMDAALRTAMNQLRSEIPEIPEIPEPQPEPEASEPEEQPEEPEAPEDAAMTADEIYAANVGSVVLITCDGEENRNYFGSGMITNTGSGFIISEDGYILTNYHVIEDSTLLTVTLQETNTTHAARVIAYDRKQDIALIKIFMTGLSPVAIGDSDTLAVGQTVCAIGHPMGDLTYSMSQGILSAIGRDVDAGEKLYNTLQTDCPVNSGNSGGPLFNLHGEVIGIVTAKYYGEDIEGLGFAVPINDAMAFAEQAMTGEFAPPAEGAVTPEMPGINDIFPDNPNN